MYETGKICHAYVGDRKLLRSLGLSTGPFHHEWTDLGTVTTYDPAWDGMEGPLTTVKVEVSSMPTHFWRFTINNASDHAGEVIEVTTGSGEFSKYWPSAKQVAEGTLWIEVRGTNPE